MRILVVSQFFPPEMGAPAGRFYDFALKWIAAGHEVTVVTGFPNFPGGEIHDGYRGRWRQDEEIDGIRVRRCWILTANRRGLGRPTAYASFLASSTLRVLFSRLEYDVVVATVPPPTVGLPGVLAAARRGVPLVLDLRDIWPEAIVQSGRLRNPAVIAAFEAVARYLYRRSTAITAVTQGWKERLVELGVPAEKIHVLPNGVDVARFDVRARDLPAAFGKLDPGSHWFAYAGIFNTPQGLDIVLDGVARLRRLDPEAYQKSQFVFVGEGPCDAELRAQVEQLGLDRVVFVPRQPRDAVYALLRRSHAVLVPLRPRKDTSTVPSKIYESLASGRPVLYQAGGEGAETIRRSGGGRVVVPGDPEALAEAMRAYLHDPGLADEDGRRGRAFAEAHYDRGRIAADFAALLEDLVRRRPVLR